MGVGVKGTAAWYLRAADQQKPSESGYVSKAHFVYSSRMQSVFALPKVAIQADVVLEAIAICIVIYHCYMPLLFAIVIYHCYLPLLSAIVISHCYFPLLFTIVICHCYMPLLYAIVICHCYLPL